ncbi:MAG TPA: dihydropyrimidinase [Micromonosporaceae bacterium]|nr:dihydropyrimidinase [Micromonosporaceae bacterium]
MRTLVAGGTVVTASDAFRADVLVDGERVAAVGALDGVRPDRVIDATARYVVPGGVDAHTHLELVTPNGVACDDFATGTAAAAWGGTTTVVDYAGHDRGEPLLAGLERWRAKAEGRAHVDYGLHMMVKEVNDQVLADLGKLVDAGVTSVKLFMAYPGVYMVDDGAIYRALCRARELGCLVALHAENGPVIQTLIARHLAQGGTAPVFHARSRPPVLEGEATSRAITLAALAGAPVYIAHLSAAEALASVRQARDAGLRVYAETCPQYLFLNEDDLLRPGADGARYVCSPPLRPPGHQEELWKGLRRGDLDVVATDHCPFTTVQKQRGAGDFTRIPNGLPGVEDRLTLVFQAVLDGRLSLTRWVEVVSTAPAKLFGLYPRKGTVAPGCDADLVVFDPGAERTISARSHHMNVDYSCYEGLRVRGVPDVVMQRGQILVEHGAFHGRPGAGQYLSRTAPVL